jgi:transposase
MPILTDAQWSKFEAAIAAVKLRGARPRKEDRRTVEAIIRRLDNGAKKWRSIPAELGNWHDAYLRFRRWTVAGVWDRIMAHMMADGEPKLAFACIDGIVVRAHQKAAGARASKSTA